MKKPPQKYAAPIPRSAESYAMEGFFNDSIVALEKATTNKEIDTQVKRYCNCGFALLGGAWHKAVIAARQRVEKNSILANN